MSRALDAGKGIQQTRIRGGLSFAYAYGDQFYAKDQLAPSDSETFKIRLQLLVLQTGIDLPSGLGGALMLPMGRIRTRTDYPLADGAYKATDDYGIGDLELRARQDVWRLLGVQGKWLPRLVVSAGAAMPTGPYVSKQLVAQATIDKPLDKTLSLGRGVWWALADAELFGRIADQLGYYWTLKTRTPLQDASDGFRWGEEVQTSVGVTGQIVPKLLSASASADYLWRQMPSEIDAYFHKRVDSASVGGKYLDATVSLRGQISDNLAVDLTGRKQLWRYVNGLQTPPSFWLFAGINWTMKVGDPPKPPALRRAEPGDAPIAEIAAQLPAGKLAIVDYWATWCAPCLKLSKQLEEYVAAHPALQIIKVDASDWDQAQMDRALPGEPGLPVIDIYGGNGLLIKRLAGSEAFDYANFLPSEATPAAK